MFGDNYSSSDTLMISKFMTRIIGVGPLQEKFTETVSDICGFNTCQKSDQAVYFSGDL